MLEYHTLLMKLSGIDGVIADWYANDDRNDYAMIHQRTLALFEMCKRRGLQFAVCYEERILKAKGATLETPVTQEQIAEAHRHLEYCQQQWFKEPSLREVAETARLRLVWARDVSTCRLGRHPCRL